jgi:type II secretory pathway predicted ATPase ExeA
MYKSFFNLKRNPFEITPDPAFLFPTRKHNEALASLYYGVRRHKGFVVLTGEVGTGKTLLVRCLLDLLNRSQVSYAYVFNSRLSALEFLQYIAGDFGVSTAGKGKGDLLLDLSSFVVKRYQQKLTTVLVVDEAHHLPIEVLEEIRLLTNLETTQQKLLQILLVGQPELDDKLDSFELRQLKQRIALRTSLGPLNEFETYGYIRRRLELSGANSQATLLFPETTTEAVYRHSRGIPRLINTLCENALINAYARRSATVLPEIIGEVASELRLGIMHAPNPADSGSKEDRELWQAAKTLLELHNFLQGARQRKSEPLVHTAGTQ